MSAVDKRTKIGTLPAYRSSSLKVRFYKSASGVEPVREWLRSMDRQTRNAIGADIKTVELGWPLGMPLVRKMDAALWELRSHVPAGIVRIFFTVLDGTMVLLHAFLKKSGKTPPTALALAKQRRTEVRNASR